MTTRDRIEDEMRWLRLLVAACLTVAVSLIGWLAATHHKPGWLEILASATGVTVFIALGWLGRIIYKKLDQLEELE